MFWTGTDSSSSVLRRALHKWGVAVVVASGLSAGAAVQALAPAANAGFVNLIALPAEAQASHRLILSGGPFPYSKDGVVFGNRERLLPPKERGHYREYTVKTPGSRDRGARRIICGGQPTTPDTCYYTADHYASFRKIVP